MQLEVARAQRTGGNVSLISGDLDHFKQINDRFGHQVGDDVLVEVARLLDRSARNTDAIARVGGEEFALLATDTDAPGAYITAERLRHRVHEALADRYPGLTISFGIASYPGDADSVDRLLRHADGALYAAKALGRDRVVLHSDEIAGPLLERPEDPAPAAARTTVPSAR
jgi:diguanylate cyclase (GGDEF)-like protein